MREFINILYINDIKTQSKDVYEYLIRNGYCSRYKSGGYKILPKGYSYLAYTKTNTTSPHITALGQEFFLTQLKKADKRNHTLIEKRCGNIFYTQQK